MYADDLEHAGRYAPAGGLHQDRSQDLMLKIVMSSMPLAGLVLGVVALALWNAS